MSPLSGGAARETAAPPFVRTERRRLGDFTADLRILMLAAIAAVIGAASAFAAWALLKLINVVGNLVWFGRLDTGMVSLAHAHRGVWMVLAPTLGGLIIGLMARYGSEKIRGHGIPEAIEAILTGESRMSGRVAILKPLSSAIAIGTGGPFGAEGPIIMTGGAIGSLFAQQFHLTAAERKTLLVAGAAAGMTAIFGTPAAAVLLAVELLLFEWKPRSFLPVVTAVIAASCFRPWLFGHGPLFALQSIPTMSWSVLLIAVGVGVAAGLQSGLLTRLLYACEDLFEHIPGHWMWRPAIGGVFVGVGGLIEPRALGVGYDVIGDMLAGRLRIGEAVLILVVKAAIWLVALSSGTSGGVLAPLLILGGALGVIEAHWLPGDPGFWTLVAMAGMMGGTMRAPLTGALFAVELTGQGAAILPMLAATGAAYGVTVLLLKRSILTEKISRRGLHLTREYSVDPYEVMRVSEVMAKPADTLPASMSVDDAVQFFSSEEHRHKSYPLVDDAGRLRGMIARADVLRWRREGGHSDATLFDVGSDSDLVVGHPDDLVGTLADLMVAADLGRAPVVEDGTDRVVGLVARKDLLKIRSRTLAPETVRSKGKRRRKTVAGDIAPAATD
ncbi:MAG TPA: chloride channel protein [Caulobacteraceae bacterium]|jgi:H+/Cl- antiporter ClcA/CBS domain-containing protein|nr:chloride channel protein [Caulobacteraceae bacterium]